MGGSLTALLVSHDGARWLPTVLEALGRQTRPVDRVLAVDTGSTDGSATLLRAATDPQRGDRLLPLAREASYPEAVRAALAALPARAPGAPDEWVWLLHDDSAPAPTALARLLAAAADLPDVGVLGAKLREWPSLRRLLEVGVTISGTGRRETGLEPGEHDQGQHDTPHDVLAVNTAGMLVRRSLLEQLGLEPQLPLLHTDLDFGWQVNRAGHRVRVVPEAVVFHVEASRSGARDPRQGRAARTRLQRQAAVLTLLLNCAAPALPLVWLRMLLGGLPRVVGLLLVRAPSEAWGELRGTLATLARPDRVAGARRRRRAARRAAAGPLEHPRVRPLLPAATTPYRHGLEELAGIVQAGVAESRRLMPDRRAAGSSPAGGPDVGRRWRSGPGTVVILVLTVAAVLAARDAAAGAVPGDALLPAPSSAADWWREYLATTHQVATGSSTTAPAYLLPLALLATLLLGSAKAALGLLVLGAVPLAALGGYRFLRRVGGTPGPAAWGAATYGLLLVTGGALQQGRVGTLAAGILLPWLATSALGLVSPSADRRTRAAWRTALWLAVIASFAPLAWLVAAVLTVVGVVVLPSRRLCTPMLVLVPVSVAALLLAPWSVLVWPDRGVAALLLEAGWPAPQLLTSPSALDVLGGRVVVQGAGPSWIGLPVPVLAALALVRRDTRLRVLAAWVVALAALAAIWLLTGTAVARPGEPQDLQIWTGFLELLLHGAWITAAVIGASGLAGSLAGTSFGWRQSVGVVAVALAALTPVAASFWWVLRGDDLAATAAHAPDVPLYLDEAARQAPAAGTLVLTGDLDAGLVAQVRRGGPTTLGQEAVLPSTDAQRPLTEAVAALVLSGSPGATGVLARLGVGAVLAGSPVDPALAERLDAAPGLVPASAGGTEGRAWRLAQEPALPDVPVGHPAWWRPALLVLQAVAVLVVVVLAAPGRRSR